MLPSTPEANHSVKMLAILEQWDQASGFHTDYSEKYFFLLLFKCGMDAVVYYVWCRTHYKSLLSMCSLSIALADFVMLLYMATMWFLGVEMSVVSPCFFLANAAATYAALPLPMMVLGLLDYCLEDTCVSNHRTSCKLLRNAVLTLLVWVLAVRYSLTSVSAEPMELHDKTGVSALVCEVEESALATYFVVALFSATIFTIPLFWSSIPQWLKEADRLSDAREKHENNKSDLFVTSTPCMEAKSSEGNYLEENIKQRPPLWFSLTLGFGVFWMPYLALCVACLVLGFAVPAYISVNLLLLECANSLLIGVVFWVKSKTRGPYSHLPENVCTWRVYWHLSQGMQQKQLPVAVFNPSKGKNNSYFNV
ncbi:probable G-protein coupled receptor 160 [Stegastes partitus]|uniref:Probable G-protein coupled receptor 160 n=1 Tax=Stegastes partitus TaxID=144197 RepID=A0A9Y4KAC9_9TELE|nr:PREDICTED: probable G-protein coupled receptor 160 [Stegastes partitus]